MTETTSNSSLSGSLSKLPYMGYKQINAIPMTRLAYNELRGWTLPSDENGDDKGYLVEYTDGGVANHADFQGYISWSPEAQFDNAYSRVEAHLPAEMFAAVKTKLSAMLDQLTARHVFGKGLTFGDALAALKNGFRVARADWIDKGVWLSLSCNPGGDAAAGCREIAFENFWSSNNSEYARQNGGSATVLPCITMKTETGEILMGWLASQPDMFAEDWVILSPIV